jgi:hypothetical protein
MCHNNLKESPQKIKISSFVGFLKSSYATCPFFFLLQAGEHEVYGSGGAMEKDDSLQPRLSATGTDYKL